jgi:hypothetical protein
MTAVDTLSQNRSAVPVADPLIAYGEALDQAVSILNRTGPVGAVGEEANALVDRLVTTILSRKAMSAKGVSLQIRALSYLSCDVESGLGRAGGEDLMFSALYSMAGVVDSIAGVGPDQFGTSWFMPAHANPHAA